MSISLENFILAVGKLGVAKGDTKQFNYNIKLHYGEPFRKSGCLISCFYDAIKQSSSASKVGTLDQFVELLSSIEKSKFLNKIFIRKGK